MSLRIVTDLQRQFGAVERDINKALAGTLNATVFEARSGIIRDSKRQFDRPRPWSTDKAWLFDKAKPADGARMFAALKAKPDQAEVLKYQIDGGIRRKGDVGATRYDVPVGADPANIDQFGGIARGVLKKTAKAAKAEKVKRLQLATRRAATRVLRNAATTDKVRARIAMRLQPMKWVVKSKNEPGTFFGTVGGVRGYWQRSARSLAQGPRRKGTKTVLPRGDNRPKLLLAFADQAKYQKRLKYQVAMERAMAAKMNSAQFGRELARIQAARSTP